MTRGTRLGLMGALLAMLALPAVVHAQWECTTNGGEIAIIGYVGDGGAVLIPSKMNGLSVTSIGCPGFHPRGSMTNWGSMFVVLRVGAFTHCTNVTSVLIPNSITNIGEEAFAGCTSLTNVLIPNSVTSIGNMAFALCDSLTTLTIPESVTSIGTMAFAGCSGLTGVAIPDGVIATIRHGTFAGCCNLTSVKIPNGVTNIGGHAFSGCSALNSVTLPCSVTRIEDLAFSDCHRLTSVYCEGNASNLGSSVFSNSEHATIYTLPGTTGWGKTFGGRPTAVWNQQGQTNASSGVQGVSPSNRVATTHTPLVPAAQAKCTEQELWRGLSLERLPLNQAKLVWKYQASAMIGMPGREYRTPHRISVGIKNIGTNEIEEVESFFLFRHGEMYLRSPTDGILSNKVFPGRLAGGGPPIGAIMPGEEKFYEGKPLWEDFPTVTNATDGSYMFWWAVGTNKSGRLMLRKTGQEITAEP